MSRSEPTLPLLCYDLAYGRAHIRRRANHLDQANWQPGTEVLSQFLAAKINPPGPQYQYLGTRLVRHPCAAVLCRSYHIHREVLTMNEVHITEGSQYICCADRAAWLQYCS